MNKWKCDFCNKRLGSPAEGTSYYSQPFVLQAEMVGGVRDGDKMALAVDDGWLACDECNPTIARGVVSEIVTLSLSKYGMEEDHALREILTAAYTAFIEYSAFHRQKGAGDAG